MLLEGLRRELFKMTRLIPISMGPKHRYELMSVEVVSIMDSNMGARYWNGLEIPFAVCAYPRC